MIFLGCMYEGDTLRKRTIKLRGYRLDGFNPTTPSSRTPRGTNGASGKRKAEFDTPLASKIGRGENNRSPGGFKTPQKPINGATDAPP